MDAPHTRPLYECAVGAPGIGHNLLSRFSGCESQVPMGPVGYAYTFPMEGTVPLYRCFSSGDHFITDDPNCEGTTVDDMLGYVFPD